MFRHLRLFYSEILRDRILADLGKINVICGKNNSGKSTIFRAISQPRTREIGKSLDHDDITHICDASIAHTPWSRYGKHSDPYQSYLDTLKQAAKIKTIWFLEDRPAFTSHAVASAIANPRLGFQPFNEAYLASVYDGLFNDYMSVVLLPPKRNLDLSVDIGTGQRPEPRGSGILNYLFFAKNQPLENTDNRIYQKVCSEFTEISSGYRLEIFPNANNRINLSFAYRNQSWIAAEYCGLGLQDLLVILIFAILPSHQVVLIEEPESHLHPEMQRKLLSFLTRESDKQYFLTTHSNVFLDNALVDRVFFTRFTSSIEIDDVTSRASILDDLGYSVADNLVTDLVILVEGPTDIPILEEFLKKIDIYPKYDIKMWPLGGDIMDQVDLTVFAQNYSIVALIDSDPKSAPVRARFERKCRDLGIEVHRLERYAIENYFTLRVLRSVFGSQIPQLKEIDPKQKLEDQIGINVKNNNRRLAREMMLEEIEGTDLRQFLANIVAILSDNQVDLPDTEPN
jgi:energy-coupling factor transporter ATP-binding protein EcfA2